MRLLFFGEKMAGAHEVAIRLMVAPLRLESSLDAANDGMCFLQSERCFQGFTFPFCPPSEDENGTRLNHFHFDPLRPRRLAFQRPIGLFDAPCLHFYSCTVHVSNRLRSVFVVVEGMSREPEQREVSCFH